VHGKQKQAIGDSDIPSATQQNHWNLDAEQL